MFAVWKHSDTSGVFWVNAEFVKVKSLEMQLYWENVCVAARVDDFLKAWDEWSNEWLIKQENA